MLKYAFRKKILRPGSKNVLNIVFSRDVTAAMLMYPTNPPGIELCYHANVFFCYGGKTRLLIT